MTANTCDGTSEEEGGGAFEGSSGDDSDLKASIVKFFQQASVDELSLIRQMLSEEGAEDHGAAALLLVA